MICPIGTKYHHKGWGWLEWTGSAFHPGFDYNGPGAGNADLNLPVYAVAAGVVKGYHNAKDGWGMMISIYHPQYKVWSIYAHIRNLKVKVGQQVKEGQHIAGIGNAYGKYSAHLHFEIRKKATGSLTNWVKSWSKAKICQYYVDPVKYIKEHPTPPPKPPVIPPPVKPDCTKYKNAIKNLQKDKSALEAKIKQLEANPDCLKWIEANNKLVKKVGLLEVKIEQLDNDNSICVIEFSNRYKDLETKNETLKVYLRERERKIKEIEKRLEEYREMNFEKMITDLANCKSQLQEAKKENPLVRALKTLRDFFQRSKK